MGETISMVAQFIERWIEEVKVWVSKPFLALDGGVRSHLASPIQRALHFGTTLLLEAKMTPNGPQIGTDIYRQKKKWTKI